MFFGAAADAARWDDGRLAVLDRQAKSIYVFGPSGSGALDMFGADGEYRATVPIDATIRMLRIRGLLAAGESEVGEPVILAYRIVE